MSPMQLNTKKIHEELDRRGWSYADLGRAMGKHRQSIWAKLNKPDKGLTLRTVNEFAQALGVDPLELLDGQEEAQIGISQLPRIPSAS